MREECPRRMAAGHSPSIALTPPWARRSRIFDEDGLADRVVANRESDHVTLLFGIAGGGFERRDHTRFRVDVSPHPHAVRVHDIDADGHADLLVDDRSPGSIRLFRGRGDGTFSGATSIDVGGDPYRGMSLADVTGDGLADLISPNPDHVGVPVAGEDGGFRPGATLPVRFGPFSVVAGDLNGDGRQDVAVASRRRRLSSFVGAGRRFRRWRALGEGTGGKWECVREEMGQRLNAARMVYGRRDHRYEVVFSAWLAPTKVSAKAGQLHPRDGAGLGTVRLAR